MVSHTKKDAAENKMIREMRRFTIETAVGGRPGICSPMLAYGLVCSE